ncbi:hypothetical protein [Longibacter salinarum]|nr:hypothetical protein [Longibacter salinarum]
MSQEPMPTGEESNPNDTEKDAPTGSKASIPVVTFNTQAFEEAVQALPSITEGVGEHGFMIVFHNGDRAARQQALSDLVEHATPTVHQFQVPTLLGERRIHTQNALRKSFDHASEEDAVLYFENVDALFTHTHTEGPDVNGEAEPTTVEYFLDRVSAYWGLVILCVSHPTHEAAIRRYTPPDLVVTFDSPE